MGEMSGYLGAMVLLHSLVLQLRVVLEINRLIQYAATQSP
jgi:hypothetical protein